MPFVCKVSLLSLFNSFVDIISHCPNWCSSDQGKIDEKQSLPFWLFGLIMQTVSFRDKVLSMV